MKHAQGYSFTDTQKLPVHENKRLKKQWLYIAIAILVALLVIVLIFTILLLTKTKPTDSPGSVTSEVIGEKGTNSSSNLTTLISTSLPSALRIPSSIARGPTTSEPTDAEEAERLRIKTALNPASIGSFEPSTITHSPVTTEQTDIEETKDRATKTKPNPTVRHRLDKPTPPDLVNFIRNGLNSAISPCHDFYGHVCSNHNSSSSDLLQNQFYHLIMPAIRNDEKNPKVAKMLLRFVNECTSNVLRQLVLQKEDSLGLSPFPPVMPKDTMDALRQMCFYGILSLERFASFNFYAANLVRRSDFPMTQVHDKLLVTNMFEKIRQTVLRKLSATGWLQTNQRKLWKSIWHLMLTKIFIGLPEAVFEMGEDRHAVEIDRLETFLSLYKDREDKELLVHLSNARLTLISQFQPHFIDSATYDGETVRLSYLYVQRPHYATEFPESYNYGFMGSTVGHELFHQFTPQRVTEFWLNSTRYGVSVNCYTEFYNGICFNLTLTNGITNATRIREVCAEGQTDVNENIPDVEGARVAFETMKAELGAEALKERAMPEFDYTNEQMYFVAAAQDFCDKNLNDHEYLANELHNEDPHASGNVRVNAIAMQMAEFAEAFHCQPGDPMVTTEKEKCYLLPAV